MVDRHYHVWLYERDTDGTINILRRHGETYPKRRQAQYALQRFRFWPGQGTTYAPGQVLACDDGAFCQPHTAAVSGITVAGPATLPVTHIIDHQTKSTRPALKETIGRKLIAEGMEAGNLTPAEAVY